MIDDNGDEPELRRRVERHAARISEKDAERMAGRAGDLERKFKELPAKFNQLINQVKLLFELIGAYVNGSYRTVPWTSIAMAVAAVLYFLSPFDLIPDIIPGLGYIDDIFVVRFAISAIQTDLRAYCEAKGYDVSKYFA